MSKSQQEASIAGIAQQWVDERYRSDGAESREQLARLCDEARDIVAQLLLEMGKWRP